MQIKLEAPHGLTGRQRRGLLVAALHSADLRMAAAQIGRIPGLSAYRGGHHVAVHRGKRGTITDDCRIAIITEEARAMTNGWTDKIAALTDRVAYLESINAALKSAAEERVVLLQELVRENAELRQDLRHNAAMLARQCDRAMDVEAAMLAGLQNNLRCPATDCRRGELAPDPERDNREI